MGLHVPANLYEMKPRAPMGAIRIRYRRSVTILANHSSLRDVTGSRARFLGVLGPESP